MCSPESVPSTIDGFADCDESLDETLIPWWGPAFDPETGQLRRPLPVPHLVATTAGWPKPGHNHVSELHERIFEQLDTTDGWLGMCVSVSERCWFSSRILVLWEDEPSLRKFMDTDLHREAARRTRELMYEWESASWVGDSATRLPTFDEARARLAAIRATSPAQ